MEKNNYEIHKKTLPLIPLRGISIFPFMVIHFDVGREKSINALEKAMLDESSILLCTQIDPKIDNPKEEDFYSVGTISKVKQMLKLPGGNTRVLVEGLSRGKVIKILKEEPFIEAEAEEYIYDPLEIKKDKTMEAAIRLIMADLDEYISLNNKISPEVFMAVSDIEDPGRLVDIIASYLVFKIEDNQRLLETFDFYERLETLHGILNEEIELLRIEDKIDQRVKKQMNKVQKEYYLKEQMKAIQRELGQDAESEEEIEEYREKIKEFHMDKDIEERLLKEVDRLNQMSPNSPEIGMLRTYLDWIIELPWNLESTANIDIKRSREILDEDHFGLEDVKERILEFIALKKLTSTMKGPILCLVGPPGVGKTSIAKSISKALDRNFVRMSLGGVRDEAEIRGHRRTYIGSMPGRIIDSMKKAGTKNPVFLFDEIDKVSSDYRGDPASALLEVLDPEQNVDFTDHFLEVPLDLSKVFFVTTANTIGSIPAPLLDRMEVIRISGYTEEEKIQIALRYLLPKQIKEHGLEEKNVQISKDLIKDIVSFYTREAGVRNLEREIASIIRKAAKRIVEEEIDVVRINRGNLSNYLGAPRFRYDLVEKENQIGVATGLAWTEVGGETLSIEVNIVKGTGKIQLTGKLGDVMKESAMAAISYIRANASMLHIEADFYKDMDIHIHVPEGAIPKDGPSAGVTMATAVISALSNSPVNKDVAMTGEITLRGRVLPVGGIKEKVLAAHRMGIGKILIPYENKRDLEEVSEKVKKKIDFKFMKNINEVLDEALIKGNEKYENN
ncbi:endopeptidase La [Tissierella creatinophila]|uniref:Lon protease n=1 Tax=Tissierella creatinophila DSM 6911 TaxID=1123403 RepID=A0A1U7M4D8_TISCR|nr:endopeptidase La [Tissierella creatinophila]OLS02058.1 Lon protease 1 [Tissierella creatinophila DSM 6911]